MKKSILLFSVFWAAISCNLACAEEVALDDPLYLRIKTNTLVPLFRALRKGDIKTIKRYMSEDMYTEKRTLLERNKLYPEFLKNYYRGAQFNAVKALRTDTGMKVDFVLEFPNGRNDHVQLYVSKENKTWRVKDSGRQNSQVRRAKINQEKKPPKK